MGACCVTEGEMTRVMFVADGEPLPGVRVRAGGDDLWTDGEGFVELDIGEGTHTLVVEREPDSWLSVPVTVASTGSIVVADVSVVRPSTGMFAIAQLAGVKSQSFGDRYTFERVLGRGGMGVVVKAQDTLLARSVAIKMLNEEFEANEEAQNIFLTEARAIATLAHPNLVAVYDVAMIDDRAMIVFEFVEGSNLEDVYGENGALSEGEVLRVGMQLGSALAYLHGQGVIHRDLKPGNAIVQSDGMVRLIDFGLARSLEAIENKGTRVRGTPAYMSPEQITGGELGPAADMYQLGVTLYELASGRLPFESGNMGYAHVHMDPPPLAEVSEGLSGGIARFVDRCLAKDPDARPSAAELVGVFEHVYAADRAHYDAQQRAMPSLKATMQLQTVTPTLGSEPPLAFARTDPDLAAPREGDDEPTPGASPWPRVAAGAALFLLGAALFAWSFAGTPEADREQVELAVEAGPSDATAGSSVVASPVDVADGPGAGEGEEAGPTDEVEVEGGDAGLAEAVAQEPDGTAPTEDDPSPTPAAVGEADDVDPSAKAPKVAREAPRSGKPKGDPGEKPPVVDEVGEVEAEVEVEANPPSRPTEDVAARGDEVVPGPPDAPLEPEVEPPPVATTEPAVGAAKEEGDDEGASDPEPKVRRVIRKKVIKKKKATVPRSF
jgi:serine/threonine-protein kinase